LSATVESVNCAFKAITESHRENTARFSDQSQSTAEVIEEMSMPARRFTLPGAEASRN